MAYEELIIGTILGAVASIVGSIVMFFLEHFWSGRMEEKENYKKVLNSLYLEVKHNVGIAGYPDQLKLRFLDEVVSQAVRSGDINLLKPELLNKVLAYRGTIDVLSQVKPAAETTLKREGVKQMQDLVIALESAIGPSPRGKK